QRPVALRGCRDHADFPHRHHLHRRRSGWPGSHSRLPVSTHSDRIPEWNRTEHHRRSAWHPDGCSIAEDGLSPAYHGSDIARERGPCLHPGNWSRTLCPPAHLQALLAQLPGPLIGVILGIVLVYAMGLDAKGVAVVGEVPAGFPLPAIPHFKLAEVRPLIE